MPNKRQKGTSGIPWPSIVSPPESWAPYWPLCQGFIDYLSIDEAAMKRIGTYHLVLNLCAVILFAINLWLRLRLPETSRIPLLLSIVGVVGLGVSGWFGGEMVYVKGMAVQAVEELSKEQRREELRRAA